LCSADTPVRELSTSKEPAAGASQVLDYLPRYR